MTDTQRDGLTAATPTHSGRQLLVTNMINPTAVGDCRDVSVS